MASAGSATDTLSKKASSFQQLGNSMSKLGSSLTRNVTLPIVGVGLVATKMATDFDNSFTKMQTLAGVSADEVEKLKTSVLGMAGEVGKSPKELADAFYFLSSSGLTGAQAMDALEMSAKASAAGLGSTEVIADAVSSAMLAYAKSGLTAAEATDVLVATARAGKAEPAELANQMGRLVPLSSELGIKFADVGGAIAALSTKGNNAAAATTQLSGVMAKLISPSKQAQEALEEVGMSTDTIRQMIQERGLLGTLERLQEVLGRDDFLKFFEDIQAKEGVLSLLGGDLEKTRDIFEQVNDSVGATDKAFGVWADSMGAKNARAFADFQVALIQIGDIIAPIAASVLSFLGDLVSAFGDLPDGAQQAIIAVAGFAAALGPLLKISGGVVDFVADLTKRTGSLSTALGSTSIAVGSVAGILAVAGYALYSYTKRKAEAEKVTNDFVDALKEEGRVQGEAINDIITNEFATSGLASKMKDAGADVELFYRAVKTSSDRLKEMHDAVKNIPLGETLDWFRDAAENGDDLSAAMVDLAEGAGLSEGEIRVVARTLSELSERFQEAKGRADDTAYSQEQMGEAVDGANQQLDAQGNIVDDATAALKNYLDAIKSTFDPFFAMNDALQKNAQAQTDLRTKQEELAVAVRDYGDGSAEAMAAQEALTESQGAARKAVVDLHGAATTLRTEMEANGLSADDARYQFVNFATQMGYTQDEALDLAVMFGFTAGEADRLGATDPIVQVSETGTAGVQYTIAQLRETIDNVPRHISVNFETNARSVADTIRFGGHLQHGGPVEPRKAYLVGERGPELFMAHEPGYIVPFHKLMRPLDALGSGDGGGGSGSMLTVMVDMRGAIVSSKADAERWVATAWNRAAASGRVTVRGRPL